MLQGAGCDVLIERNEFWAPPDASHTRCIMVDDNPNGGIPAFYSATDGKVGVGFATGNIVIRRNVFRAGPGSENYSPCIRVGNLMPGAHNVCYSLTIEDNAAYGRNIQLQLVRSDIPSLTVRRNNTPAARDYAQALGVDTTHEAVVTTRDAAIPLSRYEVLP